MGEERRSCSPSSPVTSATPAAEQVEPDLTALPVRDPERHATWLAALPEHGPRAELVLVGEDGGGRQVTLRVTDRRGTAEYVSPTEEQPGTGQAVASFPIPRPRPGEVVVEATIAADRVANAFLCTTRGARFQETVAWRRS